MAGGDRKNADSALVAGLAAGATVQDAAKCAGISETTAYRRLREPDFRHRVSEARDEMVARVVGRLSDSATRAIVTLDELLDATTPPAVRLGAARAVLEMAAKYREAEDLAERIAVLEQELGERRPIANGGRSWAG